MSYEYFARPVTFSGPSMREIRVPISRGFSGHAYVGCWLAVVCSATSASLRRERSFQHADVGPAATEISIERPSCLLRCWIRILLEQRHRCHHEAGRAEAAHQAVVVAEGLLHGMQRV